ncbi:Clp protease N-terminal domain-containing protein [Streptomyces sp. NEAU-W12]|uniref:Clp protease N-terminal domain-containing protein n=1 Tax=Streptomyces sp. NEAU-W12 TaxID=2994668 RepID=UPI00224B2D6C|nr:Clp protease N-terminal domain-containing protein [Streptomyces sp. NEAU-W12]MCX2924912.1 peptidase [Streptomyces sp. NEAU-W12]
MQHRAPRLSAHQAQERVSHRAEHGAGLGVELAVVGGARRRAVRDADRQTDTAHLLHSLLESDAEVRAVLGEGRRIARLLGYLVQRSIGYGLGRQSTVEDSGSVPVVVRTPGFSPPAAAGLQCARERAARHGGPARGVDLLAAIIADPQARAVEVLEHAGIGHRDVLARLHAAWAGDPLPTERREG